MGYLKTLDGEFLRTPQYTSAVTYSKDFETTRDIELDGNIYQNGYWIRPVETIYKGATGYVPIYLKVSGDDETGYQATATGIITEPIMGDLAYDISFGLGARWDIYSDDFIEMVNQIEQDFVNIPTVIVSDTRYVIDTLVEWINQYIIDKYGDAPIDAKYYRTQKTYPDGYGTLTDWNNSKLSEGIASLVSDGSINIGISDTVLYDNIKRLSETDENLKTILRCPIIRVIIDKIPYGEQGQYYTDLYINGYTILNNTIVTTTENNKNQHYGVLTSTCNGVLYRNSSNPETFTSVEHWENVSMETGLVFYNYARQNAICDKYGGGTRTTHVRELVYDTIGTVNNIKPYDVLPQTGLWDKQPDDTYKVGYPDPEEDDNQTPVRDGDPVPPIIIIRTKYIKGVPPEPEPDPYRPVPWDREETIPDVDNDNFYNVFEVNNTMLNSLNNALWDTSALEEIKRAFTNNPLDAIISLHQVYYIPDWKEIEGGFDYRNIYLGAYNTHIQAPIIPKRYQRIEYNPIPVNKQFKNIRDYQRDLTLYLPFIGFRQLDITDVCGNTSNSSIYISYKVDNLTGDCVAIVSVNKDGNVDRKPLYIFNGNCSSQLPLTSADRSGLLSASLSAIGGVASTVLTGGATAPSLIGSALNVANNMGMSIDRSGNITGNHGAMLYKYPFLIINYPIPFDAEDYKHYGGGASNVTTTLKYCQGYTRVSECIIDNIPCTSNEGDSIKNLLMSGIII